MRTPDSYSGCCGKITFRKFGYRARKIGICGQAPSDYPEFAQFLVEQKIDSISLNPDSVLPTTATILQTENRLRPAKEDEYK